MNEQSLKYRHDDDRCYGAAGMAIGLVVYDGEEMLEHIDIDAPSADRMLSLKPQFYFRGNPSLSAKTAWNTMLRNFNMLSAMTIANVMCRCMVLESEPVAPTVRRLLHDAIAEEATDSCSLEADENERLFSKNYNYLQRVFSHSGVQSIARELAAELRDRRRLSAAEVIDSLRALSML